MGKENDGAATVVNAADIDLLRQRPWLGPWLRLPQEARDYPTMLTREEVRMLYWLASQHYTGSGCICDLGAFLGGSTMALSSGLSANKNVAPKEPQIHSYDRYLINQQQWDAYGLTGKHDIPKDGNFLPLMPTFLGDHARHVSFYAGDFCAQPAPQDAIEILFVDIAKSLMTSDKIIEDFFPKLIPGQSIVVQQDYMHFYPFWDVAIMELLSDYFELVSYTEFNSVVFLNTKKVPDAALEACLSKNLDATVIRTQIKAAAKRFSSVRQKYPLFQIWCWLGERPNIDLAKVYERTAKKNLKSVNCSWERYLDFLSD